MITSMLFNFMFFLLLRSIILWTPLIDFESLPDKLCAMCIEILTN